MQFIAYGTWDAWAGDPGFWTWLEALSVLGYVWVQKPLRNARSPLRTQFHGICGIIAITLLITGVKLLSVNDFNTPLRVSYPDGMWDMRLNELLANGVSTTGKTVEDE